MTQVFSDQGWVAFPFQMGHIQRHQPNLGRFNGTNPTWEDSGNNLGRFGKHDGQLV